jgi:hypothetical protein
MLDGLLSMPGRIATGMHDDGVNGYRIVVHMRQPIPPARTVSKSTICG